MMYCHYRLVFMQWRKPGDAHSQASDCVLLCIEVVWARILSTGEPVGGSLRAPQGSDNVRGPYQCSKGGNDFEKSR